MNFGLSDSDWQILLNLVITPLKKMGAQVWVYGSRARGDHAEFSDIDLLYAMPEGEKIPWNEVGLINEAVENSNLPIKVDLVDEAELAQSYRASVFTDRVAI